MTSEKARYLEVYRRLHAHFGHRDWWPGDGPFEIMVGAVLTQNTAWKNVTRAIANLEAADALTPEALLAAPFDTVAQWLKPSGYFNVKAKRLRAYCAWYLEQGGFEALRRRRTPVLREGLLSVHGVGPETADDILLYAFKRPVFVIDTYTRRAFARIGLVTGEESYEALRLGFERALGPDVALFNDYHAQIVGLGHFFCRPKPKCLECPLAVCCDFANTTTERPASMRPQRFS